MLDEKLGKSEVGEFTGSYAIQVKACFNPDKDIPTNMRTLGASHSHSGKDTGALKKWADHQEKEHLKSHQLYETPPCQQVISPIYAVHKNAIYPSRVVWVSTTL